MGRVNANSRYRINLDEAERKLIRWAIISMVKVVGDGGYQDATAAFLGITPTYLRSRIKTLKIDVAEVLALAGATKSAKLAKKRKAMKKDREWSKWRDKRSSSDESADDSNDFDVESGPESEYDGPEEENEEDESGFEGDESDESGEFAAKDEEDGSGWE